MLPIGQPSGHSGLSGMAGKTVQKSLYIQMRRTTESEQALALAGHPCGSTGPIVGSPDYHIVWPGA